MNNQLGSTFLKSKKIGFIGTGNMAQAMIRSLIYSSTVQPDHFYLSNRTPGKLQKMKEEFAEVHICSNNEEVIENSDIVILGLKPQDLISAIEPLGRIFNPGQIVISLAAGIYISTLKKHLQQTRLVRVIPNTPALFKEGVIAYLCEGQDEGLLAVLDDLFSPLGKAIRVEEEDQIDALTVASSAGVGFIYELMMYWQDWIEEHGFDESVASEITVQTFYGASLLAKRQSEVKLAELQTRVASKKGVTAAGLDSMRDLDIERALRISFEKAALRNKELGQL